MMRLVRLESRYLFSTMDGPLYSRGSRGRGGMMHEGGGRGRPHSRNKHWSATDGPSRTTTPNHSDGERWERGGHRGGGRGRGIPRGAPRKFPNVTLHVNNTPGAQQQHQLFFQTPIQAPEPEESYIDVDQQGVEEEEGFDEEIGDDEEQIEQGSSNEPLFQEIHEPELETAEEREKFYQELVKAREIERKRAIAEGKMDDPLVPKRLEDAISIVGTCMDMCPRFERYRRERENNLFEWETIPGTKRVNHNRAVKMYERAAGDKTLPSDLRPPHVLKRTLDYLFHDLLPRGGFSATFNFIRDRSRAVRNDFTMQHITGPLAIECHDRCARFHILALHFERDRAGFSIPLEEQQLMNTLQSLKEFYEDQRGRYESPNELEMRVYHRLIHIRDQKERHEDIPDSITSHPVFKLTTQFRLHVQQKSAPISKSSKLIVTEEGMQIFGQLAAVLSEQGSRVMVYLVACLLERLFGKDTIDDIESIKGDLTISDIIDGKFSHGQVEEVQGEYAAEGSGEAEEEGYDEGDDEGDDELEGDYEEEDYEEVEEAAQPAAPAPIQANVTEWLSNNISMSAKPLTWQPTLPAFPSNSSSPSAAAGSAFAGLVTQPNVFGSVFGNSVLPATTPASTSAAPKPASVSVFGNLTANTQPSIFGTFSTTPATAAPAQEKQTSQNSSFAFSNLSNGFPVQSTPQPSSIFGQSTNSTPAATSPQPEPLTSQPTLPVSVFGGSAFSNNAINGNFSFSSLEPPKTGALMNPKAPEFKPSPTSSLFSQPFNFPSNNTNGKSVATPFSTAIPTTTPPATTSTPQSIGNNLFKLPILASQPQQVQPQPIQPSTPSFFTKPSPPMAQTPPSFFNKPSPHSSTTPPANRLVAPPLLKIDTNTSSGSSSPSSIASPRVPPPMPKKQPISLPSTPTMQLQPPNPLLGHLRNSLAGSPSSSFSSSSSQEILSPLVMGSPTTSVQPLNNYSPLLTPQSSRIFRASSPPKSAKRKGKVRDESEYKPGEVAALEKQALVFEQKSLIVKDTFKRWMTITTDRAAAYLEARRHGDEYHAKLQKSTNGQSPFRTSRNGHGNGMVVVGDRKRRLLDSGLQESTSRQTKKPRKRISSEYRPPRTDEELAKRLKENHEEHELRWAPGSFLQVIRKHIKSLNPSSLKMPWNIWLSMNPDSDATAIWLERKFDVPTSGTWSSESVFSIPLSSASGLSGYPGLIIFECSPLGDIADDLEKKYRVLDDCSRLREIIKALPPKRHFIPSLLIISWTGGDKDEVAADFYDMVKKLVADSTILSYQQFAMTSATKDLDNKLQAMLSSLNIDAEGKLVRSLTLKGAFKVFEQTFGLFLNEWMENCNTYGRFNWSLYGHVVQVAIKLLNIMSALVQSLLDLSGSVTPLPEFDGPQLDDSDSAYDDCIEWLSALDCREDAKMVAMDLKSHQDIEQDFPARIFIEHLFELIETQLDRTYPQAVSEQKPVLFIAIDSTLQSYKDAQQPLQMKLLQLYNFSVRRSPKRRAYSIATTDHGSPEAKRPRLSESIASYTNEDRSAPSTPQMNGNGRRGDTPSPTNSVISLATSTATEKEKDTPSVTVAMLRALTRDLKKKYVASS